MKKYLVGVVGYFGGSTNTAGGQEAKTCTLTRTLIESYGKDNIYTVDTLNWKKNPIKITVQLIFLAIRCRNIIILPAQNSIHVFVPLYILLRPLCRYTLHYAVVGGWLPQIIRKHPLLSSFAKKLDGIYVETATLKHKLEEQGFSNVFILPNYKYIVPLPENMMNMQIQQPYKLCTFSRITKEKGIEDAISAVQAVNSQYGKEIYTLDIYGKVEPDQEEWFSTLQKSFPGYIKYRGVAPFDKSVEILQPYYALLFPTRFYTEGIPGTILDAYAAGIPVISSKWENYSDIIDHETGIVYDFYDSNGLIKILQDLVKDSNRIVSMKPACLRKAHAFLPEVVIPILLSRLDINK